MVLGEVRVSEIIDTIVLIISGTVKSNGTIDEKC